MSRIFSTRSASVSLRKAEQNYRKVSITIIIGRRQKAQKIILIDWTISIKGTEKSIKSMKRGRSFKLQTMCRMGSSVFVQAS
jgi:hypothetical protein